MKVSSVPTSLQRIFRMAKESRLQTCFSNTIVLTKLKRFEKLMTEDQQKPAKPRLATSDSIPLAVSFLISLLLRWACFALALPFGLLAIVALMQAWSWWILIPSSVMTLGLFLVANLIVPRGRLVFDSRGPSVIVPAENPLDPILLKGNDKQE